MLFTLVTLVLVHSFGISLVAMISKMISKKENKMSENKMRKKKTMSSFTPSLPDPLWVCMHAVSSWIGAQYIVG